MELRCWNGKQLSSTPYEAVLPLGNGKVHAVGSYVWVCGLFFQELNPQVRQIILRDKLTQQTFLTGLWLTDNRWLRSAVISWEICFHNWSSMSKFIWLLFSLKWWLYLFSIDWGQPHNFIQLAILKRFSTLWNEEQSEKVSLPQSIKF